MNHILENLPDRWSNCAAEVITSKHDATIWRLSDGNRSAILKTFEQSPPSNEVMAYHLLHELGVPTVEVYDMGTHWVLMDDLCNSSVWRLATAADVESKPTGTAVADWYRALHDAGTRLLESADGAPSFLKREYDSLTPESIARMPELIGVAGVSAWEYAAEHIEELKSALRQYPETLSYNDFHWTNLAVSQDMPIRAVVFDYHLLGVGHAWSDIRNVCGSLGPTAREAFLTAYGDVDSSVDALDRPLSILYSLQIASRLPRFPRWAEGCLSAVMTGELESLIAKAPRVHNKDI